MPERLYLTLENKTNNQKTPRQAPPLQAPQVEPSKHSSDSFNKLVLLFPMLIGKLFLPAGLSFERYSLVRSFYKTRITVKSNATQFQFGALKNESFIWASLNYQKQKNLEGKVCYWWPLAHSVT